MALQILSDDLITVIPDRSVWQSQRSDARARARAGADPKPELSLVGLFRSWRAAVLCPLPPNLGRIWSLALIAGLGIPMTAFVAIMPTALTTAMAFRSLLIVGSASLSELTVLGATGLFLTPFAVVLAVPVAVMLPLRAGHLRAGLVRFSWISRAAVAALRHRIAIDPTIAFGIAVDDTIHLANRLRLDQGARHRPRWPDVARAPQATIPPVVTTSLIVSVLA
ncbi:hypothetical protein [Roseicyclus elongatus]|uniref:hypothetical protein n=1 Tax=Roseicyclus elongatus TaxID=159346 RepID=UPI00046D16F3|nr:hypothetical protein [Roseibacterium elongatum]